MLVIEEETPHGRKRSSAANIEKALGEMLREGENSPSYFYSQYTNNSSLTSGGILSMEADKDGVPRIYLYEEATVDVRV